MRNQRPRESWDLPSWDVQRVSYTCKVESGGKVRNTGGLKMKCLHLLLKHNQTHTHRHTPHTYMNNQNIINMKGFLI